MRPPPNASAANRIVLPNDPRWNERNIVELFPASYDENLVGLTSSPFVGDNTSMGVRVRSAPTTSFSERQLARQVSVVVPDHRGIRILGMRQFVQIGSTLTKAVSPSVEAPKELVFNDCQYPIYRTVTDPFWRFPDGNVSFHVVQDQFVSAAFGYGTSGAGTQVGLVGTDTALLSKAAGDPLPPNDGMPTGTAIGDLGVIRSMFSPWDNPSYGWDIVVLGPCVVSVYTSVWQTDPATRCQPSAPVSDSFHALLPEDQFTLSYPNVRYTRVAASLMFETMPVPVAAEARGSL